MNVIQDTKMIYERLQDELSRQIYCNRLLYNITGDDTYLQSLVKCNPAVSALSAWLSGHPGSRKIMWGAGRNGKVLHQLFPEENWICIVDRKKHGTAWGGYPDFIPRRGRAIFSGCMCPGDTGG